MAYSKPVGLPTAINNNVCKVIHLLEEGHCVVVQYNEKLSRCYHKCLENAGTEEVKALDSIRVVHVHCPSPNIFDEYIEREGYNECVCSLRGRVFIPQKFACL